jgi:hygromycin-B 7''-O-kinase
MLPEIPSLAVYRQIYRSSGTWLPALRIICKRHGLDPTALRPAPPGSHIVYWAEPGCLVKLFCPLWRTDAQNETLALAALSAETGFRVPRLLASGELEGWPYLVLTRLPGFPLDECWEHLAQPDRLSLAASLGSVLAALHRTPTANLAPLNVGFSSLLAGLRASFAARQAETGANPEWIAQCTAFLDSLPTPIVLPQADVLLHADLNAEHLFCEPTDHGWRITGLIDFGDAMLGHPYYEFIAPGFIFARAPALRRAMLLAYGFSPAMLDAALSGTLLAFTLLHRFASLPDIIAISGEPAPPNLAAVQEILWDLTG